MAEYVIEKGIPIPPRGRRGPEKGKPKGRYPWADMEPGDSILVPVEEQNMLSTSVRYHTKKHKMAFEGRQVTGGFRVWRMQ